MPTLNIQKLSDVGLDENEVEALERLSVALPPEWLAYANFEFREEKITNREIDLVLVTESAILVVELKNWTGRLESKDGKWLRNGQLRGRSPVLVTDDKCKKIKSKISDTESHNLGNVYVQPIVVLCGTATPDSLEKHERDYTVTLEQFEKIGQTSQFNKLFPGIRPRKNPLNREKEIFNRIFSKKLFDPRKLRYSGYIPIGEPIFSHTQGIYDEFYAKKETIKRRRALLRTWNLNAFPAQFATEEKWKQLTRREPEVLAYINDSVSQEFAGKSLLSPAASTPEEELSSQYFELYHLPSNAYTLESYVHENSSRLTNNARIEISRSMLAAFSEIHSANVAHRDISESSLWTGDAFDIAISRWMAASFPEAATVGPVRELLRSGRTATPEDKLNEESTGYAKDVFLLGALIYFVIAGEHLPLDDGVAEWTGLPEGADLSPYDVDAIAECLAKALAWDPAKRYRTADRFAEEFGKATETDEAQQTLYKDGLFRFTTASIPYEQYPIYRTVQGSEAHAYVSETHDTPVVVKVWTGTTASDHDPSYNMRLLRFLRAAEDLRNASPTCVQKILELGLSRVGCYLVAEQVSGTPVLEAFSTEPPNPETRLAAADAALDTVDRLHTLGASHGDVKPGNILLGDQHNEPNEALTLIDIPDMDQSGNLKRTPAYQPTSDIPIDEASKDRYSLLLTVVEVLGGSVEHAGGTVRSHLSSTPFAAAESRINSLLAQPDRLQDAEPIRGVLRELREAINAKHVESVEVPLKNAETATTLYPDEAKMYVFARAMAENEVPEYAQPEAGSLPCEVTFVGVNGALQLIWNHSEAKIVTGRKIQPRNWHQPRWANDAYPIRFDLHPAQRSSFQNIQELLGDEISRLVSGVVHDVTTTSGAERTESPAPTPADPPSRIEAQADKTRRISAIWTALIDAESDVLPEVTLTEDPEAIPAEANALTVRYEKIGAQPWEFDPNETVLIYKRKPNLEYFQIGELLRYQYDEESLAIRMTRAERLQSGDRLRLYSKLAKASYDKRRTAITRLVEKKSVFPNLIDWISGSAIKPDRVDNIDEKKLNAVAQNNRLNESQTEALTKALKYSPISLIQGPPGTGKTQFISVLIRHALETGSDNLLLTSQSHEAVNNCIEKLTSIYSDDLSELDAVRVGQLEMCSPTAAKYHIDNLQAQYRKAFENDIRKRIERTAAHLGLPNQFVSQLTRFRLATGPLIDDHSRIADEIASGATDTERGTRQQESLRRSINGRIYRISRRLSQVDGNDEIAAQVERSKEELVQLHQIRNRNAVQRLERVIQIALEWRHALASPHGNFGEFLTRSKRIVVGTCVGIARKGLNITTEPRDWVVVDEAARCSAGDLAVPAQCGKRVVLVGDHKQLPPMYTKELLESASEGLDAEPPETLEKSDFSRVLDTDYGGLASQLLNEQYRMRPAIGEMVSDVFYDRSLITRRDERSARLRLPNWLKPDVVWVDTTPVGAAARDEREQTDDGEIFSSYVNKGEARAVINMLKDIESHDSQHLTLREYSSGSERPVGIICTYAAQKREIMRQLRQSAFDEEFQSMIKVDTVDSYQGKQNAFIILSLVRNNENRDPGFLAREERLNVAVSRAMEKLIIVGAAAMWRGLRIPPGALLSYVESAETTDSRYQLIEAAK